MITITIFDKATGRILRQTTTNESNIQNNYLPEEDYLIGKFSSLDFYVDTKIMQPVKLPSNPNNLPIFNYTTKQWENYFGV